MALAGPTASSARCSSATILKRKLRGRLLVSAPHPSRKHLVAIRPSVLPGSKVFQQGENPMRIANLLAGMMFVMPSIVHAQDTGAAGARHVVEGYYAAIDRGDFRSAYAAWDRDGRASGKTFASFCRGFASTARSRVVTGTPHEGDAGMNQRWMTVPVDVYAILKNGRRQHFVGSYTLHRVVAGVGAPAAEIVWYLSSARLVSAP